VAYQADILINVRGFQDLARIQKQLEGTARKIDEVNEAAARMGAPNRTIERFSAQLQLAERSLQKVAIGSVQEQRAISNYVTALNNSNVARDRQNKLIQAEINTRNAATNAIRANVEANIAESQASRAARAEAQQLNAQLIQQERLRRKLAERGLMQLSGGGVAKGVADAGFGVQGPARPPTKKPTGLQAPGVMDAILGGGFPMLFGGGPGAVLGGAAGGFIGGAMGGMAGMALSIGLSAVGQQLDAAVVKVKEVGDAINAISTNDLRDSFIVVNAELDTTVRRLLEAGQIDKARATLAAEVAAQTGASTQAISGVTASTQKLFTAWDRFTSAVSTTAGIIGQPLLDGLTAVLNVVTLAAQGANTLLSLFAKVGPILETGLAPLLPIIPLLKQLSNAMPSGVNEGVEKRKAALEEETDNRMYNLVLMGKQERIDKRMNRGTTAAAQIQNNELDRQKQINSLVAKRDADLRAARKEFGGVDDTQLAVLEKQIQVEFKLNQRLVEREALRKRERLELEQTLDVIRATATAELGAINRKEQIRQQDLKLSQALLESGQNSTRLEESSANSRLKGYQTQLKFSTSLNETYAIYGAMSNKVNEIASTQQESARNEAEMTKLRADASVREAVAEADRASVMARAAEADKEALRAAGDLTALKEVELNNIIAQEAIAQRNIGITRETAQLAKEDADAQLVVSKALIERNRLEEQRAITVQKVAAYAADAARQTEAFNRAANEATNALNNRLQVSDALTQTALQINNIEIESLQNKLAQAKTEGQRIDILDAIREIEIENARITLESTRTQIRAEVERQRIALSMAEVKYRELQSVVALARAQKVLTIDHIEALRAQESALRIAKDNYATTLRVADAQLRAADAVYNASVNAANLKASMEGTAAAAERTTAALQQATGTGTASTPALIAFGEAGKNLEFANAWYERLKQLDAQTGTVAGKQRDYNRAFEEFLALAERYNRIQAGQRRQQAQAEISDLGFYMPGAGSSSSRVSSAMERFGPSSAGGAGSAGINPQVSITTGPVMRMGDQNYVSQGDLMSATSSAAKQGAALALSRLKNDPEARRSVGILR
jgi:hypothetical protein